MAGSSSGRDLFPTAPDGRRGAFRTGVNRNVELNLRKELDDLAKRSMAEIAAYKQAQLMEPLTSDQKVTRKLGPEFIPKKVRDKRKSKPHFHDELKPSDEKISKDDIENQKETVPPYNPLDKAVYKPLEKEMKIPKPPEKTKKFPYTKDDKITTKEMKKPHISSVGVVPAIRESIEIPSLKVVMEGKSAVTTDDEVIGALERANTTELEKQQNDLTASKISISEEVPPAGHWGQKPAILGVAGSVQPVVYSERARKTPRPTSQLSEGGRTPRKSSPSWRTRSQRSAKSVASSLRSTEIMLPDENVFSRYDDVIANIDGDPRSPTPGGISVSRLPDDQRSEASSTSTVKSVKELLDEAKDIASGTEKMYMRQAKERKKSADTGKKGLKGAKKAPGKGEKPKPKADDAGKPKDRSVDEIISSLRNQSAGQQSEADRKIQEIMDRVISRASAVLSDIGGQTAATQETITEEEEEEEVEDEEEEIDVEGEEDAEPASEQPPRVDSRASDKSQPIDTYEMIVQSVLGTEEARAPEIKKKRRRKRSRPDAPSRPSHGQIAEEDETSSVTETTYAQSSGPELPGGFQAPEVHVTAPTESSAASELTLSTMDLAKLESIEETQEKLTSSVTTTPQSMASLSQTTSLAPYMSEEKTTPTEPATQTLPSKDELHLNLTSATMTSEQTEEESESDEESVKTMLYAEDLKQAWEDLMLPSNVTHEDIISITGKPSEIQPRDAPKPDDQSSARTKPPPSALSHISSWTAVAPSEKGEKVKPSPSTEKLELTKNIHHFCTVREDIQLPKHLLGVGRKYHTPGKFGGDPLLHFAGIEYPSRAQSSIKPTSYESDAGIQQQALEHEIQERQQSAAAKKILEEANNIQDGVQDSLEVWMERAQQVFDEPQLFIEGSRMPLKTDESRLYWTPAPPKMDIPPAKVREQLFPEYYSAALPDQETLPSLHEISDESDEEEEDILDMDPEDMMQLERTLTRRYNSVGDLNKLSKAKKAQEAEEEVDDKALVTADSLATVTTVTSTESSFVFKPKQVEADEEPRILTDEELFAAAAPVRRSHSTPNLYGDLEDFLYIHQDFNSVMHELHLQKQIIKDIKSGKRSPLGHHTEEVKETESQLGGGSRASSAQQSQHTKKITGLEIEDKPTLAELALEAGRNYVMYPKKKAKKRHVVDMARIEEIERFLKQPARKLSRTESLPKVDMGPPERLMRVPGRVRSQRRCSIPHELDFDPWALKRGLQGNDDTREWVRDIWNGWFDEVFPPTQSERDAEEEQQDISPTSSAREEKKTDKRRGSAADSILSDSIEAIEPVVDSEENREVIQLLREEIEKLTLEIEQEPRAFDLGRRGAIYRKLGEIKNAKADLDLSIQLEPMLLNSYWHRHLVYLLQEKRKQALDDLNFLLRYNPKHSGAFRSRAEIYRHKNDITMAIVNYGQAIKLDPNEADTYYRRAEMYEKSGEMLLALEDYAMATKLEPTKTEALFKHGLYYFNNEQWQASINDFTDLLKTDPKDSEARTYRGRAYAKLNQWTQAVEDLSAAIHLNPNNAVAHYHRGCILRKLQPKKALQDLSVSLLLDDGDSNVMCFFHRGILYNSIGKPEDAIPDFEAVLKLDKDIASAHVNLGLIYMSQFDNYQNAIRKFTSAIRVDPTYIRAYVCRAEAYHRVHDLKNALLDFTRAIHLSPQTHHFYMYRGQLVLEMGNLDLAAYCVRHAAELNAGLGQSPTQQAVVHSFLKNYDKAIEALAAACRVKPVAPLFVLLGKTQMKAKKERDAIESFEKALGVLKPWIEKDPWPHEAAEVNYLIGICNMELRNYLNAHDAFNNAIKIDGKSAEAFYQRGLARMRLKNPKGVQDFNRALALDPKIFQAYLSRAAFYGLRGQYSKAILNCNEAIKLQPESVRAYLYRGALKYHIKAYTLAIKDLTRAASIDSQCALAYFNRAVCYHDSKNYQKALTDYGIVLLLGDALRLKVLINRGLLYFDRKDYRNALQDFLLASNINPKDNKIHHTVGLCYHKLNLLEKAVQAFTTCTEIDKFFLDGYIGRGNVLMDYGHDAGLKYARHNYEKALRLKPTYLPARVNLAYNLQVSGKYQQAWKQFTIALDISPTYKPALEGRAIISLQMSDTYAAFQDINKSVKVAPTAELMTNRGVVHQFLRDQMNAMRDYQTAITIDPTYALAYFNAANIYFNMRQFKQAQAYYDKAVQFNPKDESALLNRAITKVMLRDAPGALEDFKQAIKLSPFSAHMYFNRGNLYTSLQQFDRAEKDYTKALSIQPDDALVYKRRADVRGKLGKRDSAIKDYKYAIEIQSKKRARLDANSVTFKQVKGKV